MLLSFMSLSEEGEGLKGPWLNRNTPRFRHVSKVGRDLERERGR
jgi:hypothetical protein